MSTPAFKTRTIKAPASWLLACLLVGMPAGAAENFLTEGMTEYNAGDYANASGHLGAALNTEFNNPVLHYYMASCYVHLNQKEVMINHMDYALQNVANLVPINDELVIQVEKILFVLIFFDDHQVMNLMIQHKVHQMLMKIMMDVNNDLVLEQ